MTAPTIPTPTPSPATEPAKKPAKKRGDKKRSKKAKVASKAKRAAKKANGNGNGKPAVQGDEMKSRMVRLDARFADYLAGEAKKLTRSTGEHHSVTDVSRLLLKRLVK